MGALGSSEAQPCGLGHEVAGPLTLRFPSLKWSRDAGVMKKKLDDSQKDAEQDGCLAFMSTRGHQGTLAAGLPPLIPSDDPQVCEARGEEARSGFWP